MVKKVALGLAGPRSNNEHGKPTGSRRSYPAIIKIAKDNFKSRGNPLKSRGGGVLDLLIFPPLSGQRSGVEISGTGPRAY